MVHVSSHDSFEWWNVVWSFTNMSVFREEFILHYQGTRRKQFGFHNCVWRWWIVGMGIRSVIGLFRFNTSIFLLRGAGKITTNSRGK